MWDGRDELTPFMATQIVSHARDWTGDCIRVGFLMAKYGDHELEIQAKVEEILAEAWVNCVCSEPNEEQEIAEMNQKVERIADAADSLNLNHAYEFCARKVWRAKDSKSKRGADEYKVGVF